MPADDAKSVFLTAAEKPPAERDAYLNDACGGDDALRRRVEALLEAYDDPQSRLDKPFVERAAAGDLPTAPLPEITERPGTIVGPYKLLEQIGEGGFGVVYLAEQTEPVRRRVALKIIKPGMDSRQVIARFEAERQALAMMDHQNIARVLDAGTTDSSRPYFVMELVKGVPITEYCDANKLTVRERLELFIPVCQAIQHAHQKGIIHRDVKPSNVLVCLYDGKPVPKVIDFGVAKAIEQRLTEKTMFTQHGQVVGTLEYMSPEQAELSQLDVDTRSDIYSLGVLLYELLTGTTPITKEQLRSAGYAEMLSLIRESEPEAPSTRLSHSQKMLPTLSAQRRTEPARLGALVRGELDWIVMRSLEKDRTRRYESASALARDVERHLADEPVEACPPSMAYRARKLVRKHRAALSTLAFVAAILLIASVISTWQAVRATRAEAIARHNEQQATVNMNKWLVAAQETQDAYAAVEEERDRAVDAEERARADRLRAIETAVAALEELGRSMFYRARAVLASDLTGRRWAALEALQGAAEIERSRPEDLLSRDSELQDHLEAEHALTNLDQLAGAKPTEADLRSEAVAALLLEDARVAQEWNGIAHAVSPDGRYAASAYVDIEHETGGLTITNLTTGEEIARWEGDEAQPLFGTALALGLEAKRLASMSLERKQVTIWTLPEREPLAELTIPDSLPESAGESPEESRHFANVLPFAMLRDIGFSPDGRFLSGILMSPQMHVVLWDLENPAQVQIIGAASGGAGPASFGFARFSPDSRHLAFAQSGSIVLWNTLESRIDKEIELPLKPCGSLGFGPDGRLFIQCFTFDEQTRRHLTDRTTILVWDVQQDEEVARRESNSPPAFTPLAVAPGGRRFAFGDAGGNIRVFDLDSASEDPIRFELDHGTPPQLVAWTADGNHVLSGGMGALKRWEFARDLPVTMLALSSAHAGAPLTAFSFSPDSETIAAEVRDQPLELFDATSGQLIRTLAGETGSASSFGVEFSPDGGQLVRVGLDELIAWDVETGQRNVEAESGPWGFQGRMTRSVGFAPDGALLAAGLEEFRPLVWNVATGKILWRPSAQRGSLAVVSRDGRLAAEFTGFPTGQEMPIRVWDLTADQQRFELPSAPKPSMQTQLEFSHGGQWLLALHTQTAAGPGQHAVTHSFGPDAAHDLGDRTSPEPWVGDIWDLATGKRQMQIGPFAKPDHTTGSAENWTPKRAAAGPLSYTFSPSGRYLAVSLRDGTIRLWDVASAQQLFDWRPAFFSGRQPVAFTGDSTRLAVADPQRPVLHFLGLVPLNEQLAELDLGW